MLVTPSSLLHTPYSLILGSPQRQSAQQSCFVGDDLDVFAGLELNLFRVAAAQVQMVPVEGLLRLFDGLLQQFVPPLLSVLLQAAAAKVVLIFAAFFPRMMAKLEAGAEAA